MAGKDGGTVTYTFKADHAGTFLYESGTNPQVQVKMGLFGALIVRPAGHAEPGVRPRRLARSTPTASTWSCCPRSTPTSTSGWSRSRPSGTRARRRRGPFNLANYHPRYWLINGRGFPDSIADNFADWLPSQPYGALAEIQPKGDGEPAPRAWTVT